MKLIAAGTLALALTANLAQPRTALAWGDDGHKVVALIAQSFLDTNALKRVNALLAADTDALTPHDIASAATSADKFRDSNINGARQKTRQWHFVDIELASPDLDQACFNHPSLPAGTVASDGPAPDCVVDKISRVRSRADKSGHRPRRAGRGAHVCSSLRRRPAATAALIGRQRPRRQRQDGLRQRVLGRQPPSLLDTKFVALFETDAKSIASDLIGHISKNQEKD